MKTSEGEVVNGVINMELLSGKGMVAAIIILITMFIYIFFKNVMNTTFIDFIYQLLQIPLQRVSDSLLGILFITMMISFLWWFGINGSAIVNSVVSSIIAANTLDNQNILNETGTLTVENGAHIVTQQFQAQFVAVTGAGITIGIVVLALLFGKAKETKIMGRLSIIPSLFNINEPVLFGIPIVMNSFLLFPFMIIPIIAVLITYFSIASGLISPFSGVMVPWTTPPILSVFFIGGWKVALLQLVIMIISIVIYYPFFKMQESFRLKVNNEQKVVNAMG
ncbi:MAG: PTS sugar transporter subunit IIC [Clostridium sp.]|nr:PTS sugar transporter subunit IIC [Clostridium sp.]